MESEIEALTEQMKQVCGADDSIDWTAATDIWGRPQLKKLEPKCIRNPDEYDGLDRLALTCTQTDLPAGQQRKLVQGWCRLLPQLADVQWLWFRSKVPQDLFDAACAMKNLKALYVPWSAITDLSSLPTQKKLRYLHIGSFTQLESFDPIRNLSGLRWLQVGNVKNLSSLEPFTALARLEGLGITGTESKRLMLDTFTPLEALTELEWLHLGAVNVRDQSLSPFASLKNLKWLGLANYFSTEEFAWLSQHLDSTVCDWLQPFVRSHSSLFPCRKCKKNWRVLCSGKGGRLLCPTCEPRKLARHVHRFNVAKSPPSIPRN